ncbi:hypothetical protein VTK26DRAFT_8686 [Humicola hyalothermophila]
MTRPKVPDDKRQRTAQACDSCKRRKQKCNGLKPCQTCLKRKLMCCYTPNNASDHVADDSAASPTKRRHDDAFPTPLNATLETTDASSPKVRDPMQGWAQVRKTGQRPGDPRMSGPTVQLPLPTSGPDPLREIPPHNFKKLPSRSNANGLSEEASIYTWTRLLQDQTGRLLYVGDASTLSILQLIRIIVENTGCKEMGSPFIDDPKRHHILENIIEFPANVHLPAQLPDRETAEILIESYFTNTCGLIEIFDKASFLQSVEACYSDPPSAGNYFLCHLFLVLALGLLLAAPASGSREELVIQKQLSARPDRAELFFRSARTMCDPGYGFEDADFWSIQALSMMTVYMLIVSKRNTAYAYLGMAVRSAYALGLHREETMHDVLFSPAEMRVRRNLWKTLFILDRFLAATLGRPMAINEDDCSCEILPGAGVVGIPTAGEPLSDHIRNKSLDICVETSHVIGVTLKVFSRRKISTAKVQEIFDMSKNWEQVSSTRFYRRPSAGGSADPTHGIAALHVNLLSLHSLILLTRQLFVMHNSILVEKRSGIKKSCPIPESSLARFSEACVIASYRTIKLVQNAREDGYLPRRNPFVIYFIFAASLVICMNQFSSLFYAKDYERTISNAIDILAHCAEIDAQAERVLDIITRFTKVVANWTKDHTYHAPELSDDLSSLYNHSANSKSLPEHGTSGPATSSIRELGAPRLVSIPDPGLLTPPTIPQQPQLDKPYTRPPSAGLEARVTGLSPSKTSGLPLSFLGPRPSVSAQSSVGSSEPLSGNVEFEFDGLWESFINHLPPVSTVAPEISSLAQFPPPVIGAPTEPFDNPGF